MVRNNGGNKAKKFASKTFNISEKATRFSTDKDEIYATVNKMLGSNICEVLCIDGKIKTLYNTRKIFWKREDVIIDYVVVNGY